jgi:universal stress protein A
METPVIKAILAPVDLSSRSRVALEYACKLALPFGARVDVLLVHPETLVTNHDADRPLSERLEAARTALHRFVANVPDTRGLSVNEYVEAGNPPQRIVEWATARGADMIVLATHARVGRARSLAGSIAESVVRTALCPVVTLREPA